ncbi:MAG: tetratricopeptide repeat protein [Chloroherpetonaceae bacterium]|nr:tetratricopeptide repeat protein [Chloroherpetonaceae bacterium]MDW8438243.1 tetratricopeptide repeat protein [Chloroherpetonaceae bacterium]
MRDSIQEAQKTRAALREKLEHVKDIALSRPTQAMRMLEEVFETLNKRADENWLDLQAEAHRCLSLAQTSLARYDEAIESSRKALIGFRQLGDKKMIASVLNNLGRIEYFRANYHKALEFYQDCLALRRELGDKQGLAGTLNNIGLIYYSIENHADALRFYEESLAIKRELGDKKGIAATLNNLGLIHVLLGDYAKAIERYKESLSLRDPSIETREISNIQINIGEVYLSLGERRAALDLFQESLKMSQAVGDRRQEAIALRALGTAYQELNELDEAMRCYQDALALFEEIGLQNSVATAFGNIASIYEAKGDYDLAYQFYQDCLRRLRELGDQPTIVRTLVLIGKLLVAKGDYDLAETYLDEALQTAEARGMKRQRYEALEQLANLYARRQRFELAYETYQRYHRAKEEVFNEEQGRKLAMQQALFENEQARKEAERHKRQSQELAAALAETQRLKRIAEEANAFKTELLGIAAHDLKNPLQAVMGFAQIIKERQEGLPADIVKAAEFIERSAKRMHALIEDLLNSVKLETSAMTLEKSRASLPELLRAVVEHNRPNADKKSQTIELLLEENCFAEIDSDRMREVFDNLVSNAIKYSPRGKRIVVSLRRLASDGQPTQSDKPTDAGWLRVAVQDEGQGLTEQDKTKLFGKFQRLSARPTGGESSTGLGLSIVKQLVELHGGRVWAESEGAGKGATFFVELPACH